MTTRDLLITVRADGVKVETDRGTRISTAGRRRIDEEVIDLFGRWLRDPRRIWERREIETFGSLLHEHLFDDDVGDLLDREFDDVRDGRRLRLRLGFEDGARHLADLPWEYLRVPDRDGRAGFHLATERRIGFVRSLPQEHPRATLQPVAAPLRLLAVVSRPSDLGRVLADEVVDTLGALEEAQGGLVDFDVLQRPTRDRLGDKLKQFQPHLVHFLGHGRFDETSAVGAIALEAETGAACWVDDAQFAQLVARDRDHVPGVVVLHACEGATIDRDVRYAGTATQLIRHGVQAVVAMQYEVKNSTAITFSEVLHRELFDGAPLDRAVQEARFELTTAGDARLLGVPVLYLNSADAQVLPVIDTGRGPS